MKLVSRLEQIVRSYQEICWQSLQMFFISTPTPVRWRAARHGLQPVSRNRINLDVPEYAEPETLTGLHAKLYITDAGWKSSLWTGSANATSAAFSRNVEFLVELVGKNCHFGGCFP